jgi:hypothetical protein
MRDMMPSGDLHETEVISHVIGRQLESEARGLHFARGTT